MVKNIPRLLGAASFFMFYDDNTHVYFTVVDPRAAVEVRTRGGDTPSIEDCPLRQFCYGKSIVFTVSNRVLATVHVPLVLFILPCNV